MTTFPRAKPEQGEAPDAAPPGLFLRGTARVGDAPLFGPLDFAADAGRWTCLLGPSGVGKSTLLKLLAGIAGAVTLDGDCGAADGAPLQGRVALMAQSDLLAPWLPLERNVTFGAALRGEPQDLPRAREVLDRVGLAEHLGKRPHQLSGGQRQRAALARTLMEDRPVALLDEPFSALDPRTRRAMQGLTARLLAGRTVLHVTHDAAEAALLGERILILTETGLIEIPLDDAPRPPRRADAAGTLALAARLTRALMEAA